MLKINTFSRLMFAFVLSSLCVALLASYSFAAQKNVNLADFEGRWQLHSEKSKALVDESVYKLSGIEGFKFSVNAKAKTMLFEWAGQEKKTQKINSATGKGKELFCQLEGYAEPMILEKSSPNEILVKDRDEALVFVRIKE